MTMSSSSPTLRGAVAGLVVLLGGFATMLTFWLHSTYAGERGFTFYLSAMIGDAIILPTIAFVGTRLVAENGVLPAERRTALWACGVGALAGLSTQAAWLLSDNTVLNWTIPQLHTFNLAGSWHAGFLILSCGSFTGLAAVLIQQYRRLNAPSVRANCEYLLLCFLVVLFASLLATDNHRDSAGLNPRLALMPLTVSATVAAVIRLTATRSSTRLCITAFMVFALVATETSILLGAERGYTVASVALGTAAFVAGMGALSATRRVPQLIQIYRSAPIAVALALPVTYVQNNIWGALYSVAVSIGVGASVQMLILSFDARLQLRDVFQSIAPIGFLLGIGSVSIALSVDTNSKPNEWLASTVVLVLLVPVGRAVRGSLSPMIRAEQRDKGMARLRYEKVVAYKRLLTLACLGVVAITLSLIVTVPQTPPEPSGAPMWNAVRLLTAETVGSVVIVSIMANWLARSVALLVLAASFVYCGFWLLPLGNSDGGAGWMQDWLLVAGVVFSLAFTAEAIRANVYELHGRAQSKIAKFNIFASCLFAGCLTFSFLKSLKAVGSFSSGVGPVLVLCVLYAFGQVAVHFVNVSRLPWAKSHSEFVKTTPAEGVWQDQVVGVAMVVLGVALPIVILSGRSAVTALAPEIALLGLIASVFVYVMQNNQRHVASEARKARRNTHNEDAQTSLRRAQYVKRLRKHCNRQNMIAAIPFMTPMIVPALVVTFGTLLGAHAKETVRDVIQLFYVKDPS